MILDAWSRRALFLCASSQIDTCCLWLPASRDRKPATACCIHHSDRGAQYAAEPYRRTLAEHGSIGSMSRRRNPYGNGQAESFMKTIKCEEVYLSDYRTLLT